MAAASPFTDYTAAAIAWTLMVAFLVAVLLIGGILIVNLGLMSKRPEDHIGRRTPSDVGILKHTVWPEEASEKRLLPAEEDGEGLEGAGPDLREQRGASEPDQQKAFKRPA